jgi:hypothetical protein
MALPKQAVRDSVLWSRNNNTLPYIRQTQELKQRKRSNDQREKRQSNEAVNSCRKRKEAGACCSENQIMAAAQGLSDKCVVDRVSAAYVHRVTSCKNTISLRYYSFTLNKTLPKAKEITKDLARLLLLIGADFLVPPIPTAHPI